jgi:hypothetical protein
MGNKWSKGIESLALAMSLFLAVGIDGCGGAPEDIVSQLINLANSGGTGQTGVTTGGGGNQGAAQPETTPGQATPEPNPVPAGDRQRPQSPAGTLPQGVQAQLAELAQTYGIQVRGTYTDEDVANTLTSARHYNPANTQGLTFTFSAERRTSGVLGFWASNGQGEIYSSAIDVVFHEMTHHITEFRNNSGTSGRIGTQVVAAAQEAGGGTIPSNCITRAYARTSIKEFRAEFFTGLATVERGLPTRFTLSAGTFDPPENVRALARQVWAVKNP